MKISQVLMVGVLAFSLGFFAQVQPVRGAEDELPDVEESDLSFDPVNSRYLHVYAQSGDIFGRFYDSSGSHAGPAFVICDNAEFQQAPDAAYSSTDQMFLVVWQDSRNSMTDIYGQFVTAAGSLYGTASTVNFPICDDGAAQQGPSVDYDPDADMFLTAWADRRNSSSFPDIYGQFVTTSGPGYLYSTMSTKNFPIAAGSYGQHSPEVGYDSVHNLFLVAFMDYRDADNNIYGQFVDAADTADFLFSTAVGTNFPIGTTPVDKQNPSLAFDSTNGRFLVTWDETPDWVGWNIAGQIVNAGNTVDFLFSTTASGNILISDNSEGWQYGPRPVYDPGSGGFLVVWSDYRGANVGVYGQALSAAGSLVETASDENFPLVASDTREMDDAVPAYIPSSGGILVVYNVDDLTWEAQVYGVSGGGGGGGGCSTIGSPPSGQFWPGLLAVALMALILAGMRKRQVKVSA